VGLITKRLRTNLVAKSLAKACRQYLQWYNNPGFKFHRNGEQWLLERFRHEPIRTVFDVGANAGEWAKLAAAILPDATIYAFEIVPPTFEKLRAATQGYPAIRCFDVGLGDHNGVLPIRYNPASSGHATYTDYPWPGHMTSIAGRVVTGDSFLDEHSLGGVDVLKIDVEGAEHLVLHGLERAFAEHRIRLSYFEYGRYNVMTKFLLKDFCEFFGRHGYVVGKLFTDFVDFRAYHPDDEDFTGPHYVACRAEEPLLDRLKGD
jgi:FkbM family methyltransferase